MCTEEIIKKCEKKGKICNEKTGRCINPPKKTKKPKKNKQQKKDKVDNCTKEKIEECKKKGKTVIQKLIDAIKKVIKK